MKKAIFIDRDGTIIAEPADEQVDSLEKLEFVPGAISGLRALTGLGFELVMVSNQDGLGTPSFPEEDFLPPQEKMLQTLAGEGVRFDDILIDRSFPQDNLPTRKPGTGMLGKYLDGSYDLAGSYVIGDRETDMQLADALGAKGILIGAECGWESAVEQIRCAERHALVRRKTRETDIRLELDLDGRGEPDIDSGIKFLDHMLEQLVHHGGISLKIRCKGDLEVDEHHSVEDIAICLGEALKQALGDKRGIERYGFCLPMDESRATVLLDFGGRSELVWDVCFTREYVGDMPTELFKHFFKSLSNAAACNLYIEAKGENNHHIAEAVFKAFARALKQAVRRDAFRYELPSSKGTL
ncbi:MAG: bifunctional histidinol-phosphatase/imidazoleglycerol-phosphate dehydratase HisB [Bacteroidales bacterium]|nr:bifunctional histidinol-phosphatase/imidazoleglycerol-phosphate dehydratase HisB [Bacteroidales bacterium]